MRKLIVLAAVMAVTCGCVLEEALTTIAIEEIVRKFLEALTTTVT